MPTTLRQPDLVGGDHVGITLDHRHPTRLAARRPSQVRRVEERPLVKEQRLGTVKILSDVLALRGHRSFDLGQNSPAESERPPAIVVDRKDQPAPEPLAHRSRCIRRTG